MIYWIIRKQAALYVTVKGEVRSLAERRKQPQNRRNKYARNQNRPGRKDHHGNRTRPEPQRNAQGALRNHRLRPCGAGSARPEHRSGLR